jgi:hypothetical protein
MLAAHAAKERSLDQYTELFKAASEGFELFGTSEKEPGVHHTIVEYVFTRK